MENQCSVPMQRASELDDIDDLRVQRDPDRASRDNESKTCIIFANIYTKEVIPLSYGCPLGPQGFNLVLIYSKITI